MLGKGVVGSCKIRKLIDKNVRTFLLLVARELAMATVF